MSVHVCINIGLQNWISMIIASLLSYNSYCYYEEICSYMQCHGVQILLKPSQYIPGEFCMHFVTNTADVNLIFHDVIIR